MVKLFNHLGKDKILLNIFLAKDSDIWLYYVKKLIYNLNNPFKEPGTAFPVHMLIELINLNGIVVFFIVNLIRRRYENDRDTRFSALFDILRLISGIGIKILMRCKLGRIYENRDDYRITFTFCGFD